MQTVLALLSVLCLCFVLGIKILEYSFKNETGHSLISLSEKRKVCEQKHKAKCKMEFEFKSINKEVP